MDSRNEILESIFTNLYSLVSSITEEETEPLLSPVQSQSLFTNDEIQSIVTESLDNLSRNSQFTNFFDSVSNNFRPVFTSYSISTPEFTTSLSNFGDNILDMLSDSLEDVPVVLSEDNFNKLKSVSFGELTSPLQSECTICQESFTEDKQVTELVCKHVFCKDCVSNWLTKFKCVCPICKQDQRESIV